MSYASEVLADSPVGYYRLSDLSGDPVDSSGHGLDADAAHGAPTYSQSGAITSDPSNNSILFHSSGPDWFHLVASALWEIGDVGSVECWLKRSDSSTAEMEIVNRDQGFYLGLINNRLFIAKTSVAGIAQSTITITDTTTWHHCVNTKNGSTVHQYIDGVDVTGTVTDATWTNIGAGFGAAIGSNAGSDPYNGYLDEVAIYGTALSQARVTAHFNAATASTDADNPPIGFLGRGAGW